MDRRISCAAGELNASASDPPATVPTGVGSHVGQQRNTTPPGWISAYSNGVGQNRSDRSIGARFSTPGIVVKPSVSRSIGRRYFAVIAVASIRCARLPGRRRVPPHDPEHLGGTKLSRADQPEVLL